MTGRGQWTKDYRLRCGAADGGKVDNSPTESSGSASGGRGGRWTVDMVSTVESVQAGVAAAPPARTDRLSGGHTGRAGTGR